MLLQLKTLPRPLLMTVPDDLPYTEIKPDPGNLGEFVIHKK